MMLEVSRGMMEMAVGLLPAVINSVGALVLTALQIPDIWLSSGLR